MIRPVRLRIRPYTLTVRIRAMKSGRLSPGRRFSSVQVASEIVGVARRCAAFCLLGRSRQEVEAFAAGLGLGGERSSSAYALQRKLRRCAGDRPSSTDRRLMLTRAAAVALVRREPVPGVLHVQPRISQSRVSLATIDAAAIAADFQSPCSSARGDTALRARTVDRSRTVHQVRRPGHGHRLERAGKRAYVRHMQPRLGRSERPR